MGNFHTLTPRCFSLLLLNQEILKQCCGGLFCGEWISQSEIFSTSNAEIKLTSAYFLKCILNILKGESGGVITLICVFNHFDFAHKSQLERRLFKK